MLTIPGRPLGGFCDRASRRQFLRVGSLAPLGAAGLSLADLLRADEAGATGSRHKSVIMIYLPGGPPHQDMVDLKPEAPSEVRGEFKPVATNVPGIEVCELMPRIASMMDKFAVIRSIVGATGDHYSFQCLTGRSHQRQPPGGWPEFGSVVAKQIGRAHV